MAEWSIAAVLKTVELRGSGGSNPSFSAEFTGESCKAKALRDFLFLRRLSGHERKEVVGIARMRKCIIIWKQDHCG